MGLVEITEVKWRTGNTEPTFIFAQVGKEPSDTDDVYIGMMKSIQVAREVVASHNARLESRG